MQNGFPQNLIIRTIRRVFYSVGTEEIQPSPSDTTDNHTGSTYWRNRYSIYHTQQVPQTRRTIRSIIKWDWNDGTVSDWFGPFNSGTVVSASHTWTVGGEYQIKVKARDRFYLESSWSETLSVFIDSPPATPVAPSGPILGLVGVEYTYATSTTDPENDPVYYKWDWGDGTVSDWLGPFNSGVVVTASHSWSVGDDYQIKVKAKDTYPLESAWSPSLPIVMDSPPATPVTPSGPILGEVGVQYSYTTSTF